MFGGEKNIFSVRTDIIESNTGLTIEQSGRDETRNSNGEFSWLNESPFAFVSPNMQHGELSQIIQPEGNRRPNFGPFPEMCDDHQEFFVTPQQQLIESFYTKIVPGMREDPVTGTQFFTSGSMSHISPFFEQRNRTPMLIIFGPDFVVQNARCVISEALEKNKTVFILRTPMPLQFYMDSRYMDDILRQAEHVAPSVVIITDDPILTLCSSSGKIPLSTNYYKGFPLLNGPAMCALSTFIVRKGHEMRRGGELVKSVKVVFTTSAGPDMFNKTMIQLASCRAAISIYPTFVRERKVMRRITTEFFKSEFDLVFPQARDTPEEVDQMWKTMWECVYHTTIDGFVFFLRKASVLLNEAEPENAGDATLLYTSSSIMRVIRTRRIMIRDGAMGRITGRYTLQSNYQNIERASNQSTRFFADVERNDDRFPLSFKIQEEQLADQELARGRHLLTSQTQPVPMTALPQLQTQQNQPAQTLTESQTQSVPMTVLPQLSTQQKQPAQTPRANVPAMRSSGALQIVASRLNTSNAPSPPISSSTPTLTPTPTSTSTSPVDELEEGEMTEGEIDRAESCHQSEIAEKRDKARNDRRDFRIGIALSKSGEEEIESMMQEMDDKYDPIPKPILSENAENSIEKFHPKVRELIVSGECPRPLHQEEYLAVLKLVTVQQNGTARLEENNLPPQEQPPHEESPTSPSSVREIAPLPSSKSLESDTTSQKPEKEKQPLPSNLFTSTSQSHKKRKNPETTLSQIAAVLDEAKSAVKSAANKKKKSSHKMANLLRGESSAVVSPINTTATTTSSAPRKSRGIFGGRRFLFSQQQINK